MPWRELLLTDSAASVGVGLLRQAAASARLGDENATRLGRAPVFPSKGGAGEGGMGSRLGALSYQLRDLAESTSPL